MRPMRFVVAVAVFAVGVVGQPAQVATAADLEAVAAYGNAPGCIKRYVGEGKYANGDKWWHIQVANQCGRTMRVKVALKRKADFPCVTLTKGQTFSRYGDGKNPYQKTKSC
jgi:hypothetical protein